MATPYIETVKTHAKTVKVKIGEYYETAGKYTSTTFVTVGEFSTQAFNTTKKHASDIS